MEKFHLLRTSQEYVISNCKHISKEFFNLSQCQQEARDRNCNVINWSSNDKRCYLKRCTNQSTDEEWDFKFTKYTWQMYEVHSIAYPSTPICKGIVFVNRKTYSDQNTPVTSNCPDVGEHKQPANLHQCMSSACSQGANVFIYSSSTRFCQPKRCNTKADGMYNLQVANIDNDDGNQRGYDIYALSATPVPWTTEGTTMGIQETESTTGLSTSTEDISKAPHGSDITSEPVKYTTSEMTIFSSKEPNISAKITNSQYTWFGDSNTDFILIAVIGVLVLVIIVLLVTNILACRKLRGKNADNGHEKSDRNNVEIQNDEYEENVVKSDLDQGNVYSDIKTGSSPLNPVINQYEEVAMKKIPENNSTSEVGKHGESRLCDLYAIVKPKSERKQYDSDKNSMNADTKIIPSESGTLQDKNGSKPNNVDATSTGDFSYVTADVGSGYLPKLGNNSIYDSECDENYDVLKLPKSSSNKVHDKQVSSDLYNHLKK
ncbi:unnamed protein product [Owenia fusiformis]|uniref:Uncharacterized protein n=1 Tax=Owenia fusiformis TaxID=6347 RepID=A0A8J1Y1B8_OWEFU|nr:unnamed protein product [Owenia fusiformis]